MVQSPGGGPDHHNTVYLPTPHSDTSLQLSHIPLLYIADGNINLLYSE